MSGGFVGVSIAPTQQLTASQRAVMSSIESPVAGPDRVQFGEVAPGADVVITWRRSSGIGTAVHETKHGTVVEVGGLASTGSVARPIGVYSRIELGPAGISVSCDLLGYGSLFYWAGHGVSVVATRPELVAELARAFGATLTCSATAAADLAFIGWVGPTTTGWSEVRAVPAGGSLALSGGAVRMTVDDDLATWAHEPKGPRRPLDEILDDGTDALLSTLERTVAAPFPVYADLTAGTDSRLIVAGLAALGALDDIPLQTIGGPGLVDVDVAASLAAHLGAQHRTGYPYPFGGGEFDERFRAHVADTCGSTNPMVGIRERPGVVDGIRISGLIGEVVTGWHTNAPRAEPARAAVDHLARAFQAGRADLLLPDAEVQARQRHRDYVLAGPHGDLAAWFAAHRLYGEALLRGRMSRVDDFTPEVRTYPLYDTRLIAAGLECLWHHPDADFAALLTDRLAPGLNETARRLVADAGPAGGKPPSFMQVAAAAQSDERLDLLTAVSRTDSDAWAMVDRGTFVALLESYTDLKRAQLRQLNGAAAAVLWMADEMGAGRG